MRHPAPLFKLFYPKFLLVLFQKPITTYANPGVLLVKFYPPADLLHHPSEKIADFKTINTKFK